MSDPSAAGERTTLARRRSALAAAVLALLVARNAALSGSTALAAVAVVAAVLVMGAQPMGRRADGRSTLAVAATVLLLALVQAGVNLEDQLSASSASS